MLLSTFWFALMNVLVKKLAHLPTHELVFFRCGIAVAIGFIGLQREGVDWIGSNRRLLLLRGLFGTMGLFSFFYTVQHMPLGTAVTIQYLSPVFTAIAAMLLLREPVKPVQWIFFLICFAGVLLVKGFNMNVSWNMLALGIFGACCSAMAYTMVRSLRGLEHPLVVVLHFQLLGAVVGMILCLFNFTMPQGMDWLYLIGLGIFTQLGQITMTRSLQAEKAARVTILNYLGIFYALVFGWFLFGETHAWIELSGMLLVVAGVLLNLRFSQPQPVKA